jgi:YHS domain-containing protein
MVSLLLRLLLFVGLLWLFRYLWAIITGTSQQTAGKNKAAPASKNMVKDPVCGMYMDPRLASRIEKGNGTFYFCSEKCKNEFLSTPPGSGAGTTPG